MGSDILILYSKRGCIDTGMTGVGGGGSSRRPLTPTVGRLLKHLSKWPFCISNCRYY